MPDRVLEAIQFYSPRIQLNRFCSNTQLLARNNEGDAATIIATTLATVAAAAVPGAILAALTNFSLKTNCQSNPAQAYFPPSFI